MGVGGGGCRGILPCRPASAGTECQHRPTRGGPCSGASACSPAGDAGCGRLAQRGPPAGPEQPEVLWQMERLRQGLAAGRAGPGVSWARAAAAATRRRHWAGPGRTHSRAEGGHPRILLCRRLQVWKGPCPVMPCSKPSSPSCPHCNTPLPSSMQGTKTFRHDSPDWQQQDNILQCRPRHSTLRAHATGTCKPAVWKSSTCCVPCHASRLCSAQLKGFLC